MIFSSFIWQKSDFQTNEVKPYFPFTPLSTSPSLEKNETNLSLQAYST